MTKLPAHFWRSVIANALRAGRFTAGEKAAARSWAVCPASEMFFALEREQTTGYPTDEEISHVSDEFLWAVNADEVWRAASLLRRIEALAGFLERESDRSEAVRGWA